MSKYINVLLSDGGVVQLLADVDVCVSNDSPEGKPPEQIHLADLLYGAVLDKTREQEAARLPPGTYTIRLMAVVVGEADEV